MISLQSERLQILQALAKSLTLADDVDLAVIADMCDNFTGADFKALLYNAQLAAIHRSTNSSQLYKGLFSDEDSERSNPEQFRKDAFFIPSLTEGVVHLPDHDQNKLSSEVTVYCLTKNYSINLASINIVLLPKALLLLF